MVWTSRLLTCIDRHSLRPQPPTDHIDRQVIGSASDVQCYRPAHDFVDSSQVFSPQLDDAPRDILYASQSSFQLSTLSPHDSVLLHIEVIAALAIF